MFEYRMYSYLDRQHNIDSSRLQKFQVLGDIEISRRAFQRPTPGNILVLCRASPLNPRIVGFKIKIGIGPQVTYSTA